MIISLWVIGCQGSKAPDDQSSTNENSVANRESFDEVKILTEDGLSLDGRLYGFGKTGVVLSHMFPSDQSSWNDFALELTEKGYIVLTFNFRGYGDSDEEKNPAKNEVDEKAAIKFMKEQGTDDLFLIGASMGEAAALKAGADKNINGIVSISAPISFRGISVEKEIVSLKKPKLFIVSSGDLEALKDARWSFDNTPKPKDLEIFDGDDHGSDLLNGEEGEKVKKSIFDFLKDDDWKSSFF